MEGVEDPEGDEPVILTRELLESYFNCSLASVSKELGICPTSIKKACRKLGIAKWPFKSPNPGPKRKHPIILTAKMNSVTSRSVASPKAVREPVTKAEFVVQKKSTNKVASVDAKNSWKKIDVELISEVEDDHEELKFWEMVYFHLPSPVGYVQLK